MSGTQSTSIDIKKPLLNCLIRCDWFKVSPSLSISLCLNWILESIELFKISNCFLELLFIPHSSVCIHVHVRVRQSSLNILLLCSNQCNVVVLSLLTDFFFAFIFVVGLYIKFTVSHSSLMQNIWEWSTEWKKTSE